MQTTRTVRDSETPKKWYLVNAEDEILGRLSSNIAKILHGKHKPTYTPNFDNGDFVIVVNAEKIRLSGNKKETKIYSRFSGYPGGLKNESIKEATILHPERILFSAVHGMLPHSKLGRAMIKKLKIYKGVNHPHDAQTPQLIKITKRTCAPTHATRGYPVGAHSPQAPDIGI